METKSIVINCSETTQELNSLESLIDDYRHNIRKKDIQYSKPTDFEKDVFGKIQELIDSKRSEIEDEYINLYNFFSTSLNRWWLMTIEKESKSINNEKSYTYTSKYYIFPYRIIEDNGYIFMLSTNEINDKYKGGIEDKSISIYDFMNENTTITLNETTKDEFIRVAELQVNKAIQYRLGKIENEGKTYSNN